MVPRFRLPGVQWGAAEMPSRSLVIAGPHHKTQSAHRSVCEAAGGASYVQKRRSGHPVTARLGGVRRRWLDRLLPPKRAACDLIGYVRPKGNWVRGRGAVWTDDEMLDELRRLRLKYGHLSAHVINADVRAPSVGAYQRRFGSLLKAYGAAGFPLTYRKSIRDGMRRLKNRGKASKTIALALP